MAWLKIKDILKNGKPGEKINAKGWVRTKRGSKNVNFVALNDGSIIHNLQVVVDVASFDEDLLKDITTGAAIEAAKTLN